MLRFPSGREIRKGYAGSYSRGHASKEKRVCICYNRKGIVNKRKTFKDGRSQVQHSEKTKRRS
jgi:hypothetical protein